jgi:hypothetical protein
MFRKNADKDCNSREDQRESRFQIGPTLQLELLCTIGAIFPVFFFVQAFVLVVEANRKCWRKFISINLRPLMTGARIKITTPRFRGTLPSLPSIRGKFIRAATLRLCAHGRNPWIDPCWFA